MKYAYLRTSLLSFCLLIFSSNLNLAATGGWLMVAGDYQGIAFESSSKHIIPDELNVYVSISVRGAYNRVVEINYHVFEPRSVQSILSGNISYDLLINKDGRISYENGEFSFNDGEQSFQFTVSNGFMHGEINTKYAFMCWSSPQLTNYEYKPVGINIHKNELTGYYQGVGYNPLSPNSAERVIDVYMYIKKDIAGTHLVFQGMRNEPLSDDYPIYSLLPRSPEDKVSKFFKREHDVITLVLRDGVLYGTIKRRIGNSYSFVCKPSLPIY